MLLALVSITVVSIAQVADSDGDGVPDNVDNCINVANPDQRDSDHDGVGDVCDGDINKDGIVNAIDLSLLGAAFGKTIPNESPNNPDFNGDGVVNALDLAIMHARFGLRPGPSAIKLPPKGQATPPVASSAEFFQLDRTLPDGSNGAAMFAFGTGLGTVVPAVIGGRDVSFRDDGAEPDEKAGDGIFSAFIKLDTTSIQSAGQSFLDRLQASPSSKKVVLQFSGHDFIGQQPFDLTSNTAQSRSANVAQSLPSGITLIPFLPVLPNLPILPALADPMKALMVTDKSVVADRTRTFDPCDVDSVGSLGNVNGVWSFKTLMTNMANTAVTAIPAQTFVHNWLRQWSVTGTVNTFSIPPRTPGGLSAFFPGWDGVNPATLNMDRLPFRLLAIVNRLDLGGGGYGIQSKAGEIRFVFGLVRLTSSGCHLSGSTAAAEQMTVIFEYGDTAASCDARQTRANQWINLSKSGFSAAFNSALQAITDDVTAANAVVTKPNHSAINQVRTNEVVLFPPVWQLREFTLNPPDPAHPVFFDLAPATIKQTPDPGSFRLSSATTAAFWGANADKILCETHVVPEKFPGVSAFLGSHADYGFGSAWDAPGVISGPFPSCWKSNVSSGTPSKKGEVRHKFSLNACDDCHSGETATQFTHVKPAFSPATLSGFMTGIDVPDPGGEPVVRHFNDLARRGQALEDTAQGCRFLPTSFSQKSVFALTSVE